MSTRDALHQSGGSAGHDEERLPTGTSSGGADRLDASGPGGTRTPIVQDEGSSEEAQVSSGAMDLVASADPASNSREPDLPLPLARCRNPYTRGCRTNEFTWSGLRLGDREPRKATTSCLEGADRGHRHPPAPQGASPDPGRQSGTDGPVPFRPRSLQGPRRQDSVGE